MGTSDITKLGGQDTRVETGIGNLSETVILDIGMENGPTNVIIFNKYFTIYTVWNVQFTIQP